jgi:predicted ATPase
VIKRIKIRGYKSFDEIDLRLEPLSVLFGPNGAGKSNLLDALQLLSRIATSRTLKEAFEPPYRGKPLESFTFGANGIPGLLGKKEATFLMEVDVELSPAVIARVDRQIREMKRPGVSGERDGDSRGQASFIHERALRYRVEVEIQPKSGLLYVKNEYVAALNKAGEPTGSRKPFLELQDNRLHLRMEGQAHPTYHDTYLDHTILSLPLYYPHYPHLVALREELASWFFFYFEPRERMRVPNPVKEVRHIGLMGENLAAFLNTLKGVDEPQFRAVERALKTIIPTATGIDVKVDNLGEVELRIREGETLVPARVVSEGTLRVLGLLALSGVREPPALTGFEEPENGINPRRVRLVAELLRSRVASGDTQIIVTTHSPLFLDLIDVESLFVCRKVNQRTLIDPFETLGPLFRSRDVDKAIDAEEEALTTSQRILRGDFDE